MYSARREPRQNPSKGDHHCNDCGEYFRTPGALFTHHKRIHLQQSRGDCVLCNLGFESGHYLKKHLRLVHHDCHQVPVRCSQCLVQFLSVDRLVKHAATHHSPQADLYCRFCSKRFSRLNNLRRHEESHQGDGSEPEKFTCPYCFKSCSQVGGLALHMSRNHSTARKPKTKCPFCAREFAVYSDYTEHVVKHHGDVYKQMRKCNFCLKTFDTTRQCDEHCCRVHGKSDFRCPICEEIFSDPQSGVRHLKTHEEVRDREFECKDCDEMFPSVPMMIRHRLVAHPMQVKLDGTLESVPAGFMDLVKCDGCGNQALTWRQHLRHLRSKHPDTKIEDLTSTRNQCAICKEQFDSLETLNDHVNKSHNGMEIEFANRGNKRQIVDDTDDDDRKKLKRMEDYVCRTFGPQPTHSAPPMEEVVSRLVEGSCASFRDDQLFRSVDDIDPMKNRRLVCESCQFIANNDMEVYEHARVHCKEAESTLFVVRRKGGLNIIDEKDLPQYLEDKDAACGNLLPEVKRSVENNEMKAALVISIKEPSNSGTKPQDRWRELDQSERCSLRVDFEKSGDTLTCRECQCPVDNLFQHTAFKHGGTTSPLTLVHCRDGDTFSVLGTVDDPTAFAKRRENFLKSEQYEKLDQCLDFPPTRNSETEGFRINFAKLNVSNADEKTYDSIWCPFCVIVVPKDKMTEHLNVHNKEDDLYIEENEHAFSVYNLVARKLDDVTNAPRKAAAKAQDRQEIARILCEFARGSVETSDQDASDEEPNTNNKEVIKTPKDDVERGRSRGRNTRVLIVPSRKIDNPDNDGIHVLYETMSANHRPVLRWATRKSDLARSANWHGQKKTTLEYLNTCADEESAPSVCHVCRRQFADFHLLWEHARAQHNTEPGNAIFFCDQCPKVFEKKGYLKKHTQYFHHVTDDLPACPICRTEFTRLSDLGRHMTEHTNQADGGNVNFDGVVTMDDATVLADGENVVASRNLNETDDNVRDSSPSLDSCDISHEPDGEEVEEEQCQTNGVFQCSECESRYATLAEVLYHMNESHTCEVFDVDITPEVDGSSPTEPLNTIANDDVAPIADNPPIPTPENRLDSTSKSTQENAGRFDPSRNVQNAETKVGNLDIEDASQHPVALAMQISDESSSVERPNPLDMGYKKPDERKSELPVTEVAVSRFFQFSGTQSDIERALNLLRTIDNGGSSLVVRECELV